MARLSDRGFTASRGLSFTLEDTATNVDTALAGNITHNLGALPSALELWVEQDNINGIWEKHDPATYVLATATELQSSGTTLISVFTTDPQVRLVAAAGAVAVSVQEASASVPGIVGIGTQSFAGAKTFTGEISTDASHLGGYGLLPVGAIVAYNPGYYTNTSNGSFTVVGPAGNTVAQVNSFLNAKGWYVCDGAALNVAASPIWNAASRHLPNLDDSRFLMGSTSAGTQGGSDTSSIAHTHSVTSNVTAAAITLSAANLPSHTHSINHDHGAFTSGGESGHTHSIAHNHAAVSPSFTGSWRSPSDSGLFHDNVNRLALGENGAVSGSKSFISVDLPSISATSGAGSSHTHSIDVPNFTGTSGSTGSGTSFTPSLTNNAVTSGAASVTTIDILPTYLTTYFIVRAF